MRRVRAVTIFLALSIVAGAARSESTLERGFRALEEWQLEDAITIAQTALAAEPDNPTTLRFVGEVLHQRGEHAAALEFFAAAAAKGEDDGFVQHLAEGSARYAAHFGVIESKHFKFFYIGKDEIVARYARDVLEAAYTRTGKALDILPAERGEKIAVEIYPNAQGLAAATGLTVREIATSGTIAVCKFHRLMITSPLTTVAGYHWAETLAHEFVHLLVSKKSHNNIPIWLHEGIAKFFESTWKGDPGESFSLHSENLLANAVKKNDFVTFAEMHPSMAKLPSQERAGLAFAEVFVTIEALTKKHGLRAIPKLLDRVGSGASLEQALKSVFGMNLKQIERYFQRYARRRQYRQHAAAPAKRIVLTDDESTNQGTDDPTPLGTIEDKAVYHFARIGELLQLRGHHQAAIVEYEKALEKAATKKGPGWPSLNYRLARAHAETGSIDKALTILEQTQEVFPDYTDAGLLAARLLLHEKRFTDAKPHLEAARFVNPFNPDIHRGLKQVYRHENNVARAAEEERYAELSLKRRQHHAYSAKPSNVPTTALRLITKSWLPVRVDGGAPVSTPRAAYAVEPGRHDIEFVNARGKPEIKTIDLKAGEHRNVILP